MESLGIVQGNKADFKGYNDNNSITNTQQMHTDGNSTDNEAHNNKETELWDNPSTSE